MQKSLPFLLTLVALFIGIISPDLFSDGMFMDGLLYSVISKNMANGLGSFWTPHLTDTYAPAFFAHPPLAFGLQAICFKIFGDSILVERFYSLMTYFITGFILFKIWNNPILKSDKGIFWLPYLFWLSIPLMLWAVSNNLLENTMMVFSSLSVLYMLKSLGEKRYLWLFFAGIAIFCGFMTKGFAALFPLSFWLWLAIFTEIISCKRALQDSLLLLLFTLIPFLLLWLFVPESIFYLEQYIHKQIVPSVAKPSISIDNLSIVWKLFTELLPALFLLALLLGVAKWKKIAAFSERNFSGFTNVFLALGLSASLPLIVSHKQSGFYLITALPFFALSFALWTAPIVSIWVSKFKTENNKIFTYVSILLLFISLAIGFVQKEKIGRDRELIQDTQIVLTKIPANSRLGIPVSLYKNWALHGYFARYANVSLDTTSQQSSTFFLKLKSDKTSPPESFILLPLPTKQYDLHKRALR